MVKLFEKKPVSDHILVSAFPSAKAKGELCVFGSLIGFSDYGTASGEPGSVNAGKMIAVVQAAIADIAGTVAIGTDVYITSTETLSATSTGNTLLGTVVAIGGGTYDIAVTG